MEVVVQGNADSLLACSPKEDCDIVNSVHSNLGNMDGVELAFADEWPQLEVKVPGPARASSRDAVDTH